MIRSLPIRACNQLRRTVSIAAILTAAGALSTARAAEHITLRNGFAIDCVRRAPAGDPAEEKVRLYFNAEDANAAENFLDVAAADIVRIEALPDPPPPIPHHEFEAHVQAPASPAQPSAAELHQLLTSAGTQHHIDADLLASVVHAESGGRTRAVSRTGARGLMQLMPATAAALGVQDSFAASQNIFGGSAYLDALLTRYHDNIALALAAYNAGPAAVDRFHGVPPFRETRAYVSRVIREFNRRKSLLLSQAQPLARGRQVARNQPPPR